MSAAKDSLPLASRNVAAVSDRLLDVREVASRLGVSARQIWKLCASKRLPRPVRLSRSVRWRESDLTRFIESGCDMNAFDTEQKAVRA
jgi:predicted DNA-binding transcriptional regulator AlpA